MDENNRASDTSCHRAGDPADLSRCASQPSGRSSLTRDMVERCARALCARHYADRFEKPLDDPHVVTNVNSNWMLFVRDARTVIEAMRKPTPKMCFEGARAAWAERNIQNATATDVWQAMIDVALRVSDEHAKRENAKRSSPEGMPARPSDSEGRP